MGSLRRPRNPMPANIRRALTEKNLMRAYQQQPAYQRNDYLGWIGRAKLESTRRQRLKQMLEELSSADTYMKMKWSSRSQRK